ncbi:MAG: alpha-L-fucosidase [Oscillospiraceae bacterium]|nr:alpha-L-fucosidase [Oscillospiraceae bacterium]
MGEYKMTGAELASQLKGQLNNNMLFNGISGVDDENLHLSEADIKWWRDAKLGLFVHWGIYSVVGKGEWAYFNEGFTQEEYRKIAEEQFKPQLSAEEIAAEWLDCAEKAGMKYAVMTTRHHDGFSLWDSKCSEGNFTSSAIGCDDYVKSFTDECHKRGIHTGLYYSPMDWRFEGYFDPHGKPESALKMKQQAYGQIRELCTQYGRIDILWYDGGWLAHNGTDADAAWLWEPIKLNKSVRELQPNIMVSPRSGYRGDFECDEGVRMPIGSIVPIPWEKCMSVSQAWGYMPNDRFMDSDEVIKILVNTVCRDGNMLLNVGPDVNGRFPAQAKKILSDLGEFMRENGESIYGTRAGLWQPVDGVFGSTCKGDAMYLHILDCNKFNELVLPEVDGTILLAALLDGTTVPFEQQNGVRFSIPDAIITEGRVDTVIKLIVQNL